MPNGIARADSTFSLRVVRAATPEPKASTIPGMKWWMWRLPTWMFPVGHQDWRIPQVARRAIANAPRKPWRMLKSTVS